MIRFLHRVTDLGAVAAGWLFFAIGVMITYEVTARYGFSAPTIWAEEMSRFCQIWAVYLGAAFALRHGHLIRFTLLIDRLDHPGRRIADTFSLILIMSFAAIALWWGTVVAIDSLATGRTTTTMLAAPTWISETAIPVGAALLLLQGLSQIIRLFAGATSPGDGGGPIS